MFWHKKEERHPDYQEISKLENELGYQPADIVASDTFIPPKGSGKYRIVIEPNSQGYARVLGDFSWRIYTKKSAFSLETGNSKTYEDAVTDARAACDRDAQRQAENKVSEIVY